jgi:hypothetical protein
MKLEGPEFKPVIVIGAPRSGTNMLRDLLCLLPGTGTWPCDEINYIWRHGNVRYPSDEFSRDMATQDVKCYIQKQFQRLARSGNYSTVVEKTCANSLRVGFIDAVVPDAKYIFIVRDGVDVVASAMLRWKASLDIPYLARKARYVPVSDLPYYAARYIGNRIRRLISPEGRLAIWGPQLDGMARLQQHYSLPQISALQWKACVNNAERDLSEIESERTISVRYEGFVNNPAEEFKRLTEFIGVDISSDVLNTVSENVSDASVGKGRAALEASELSDILLLISDELGRYGYHA